MPSLLPPSTSPRYPPARVRPCWSAGLAPWAAAAAAVSSFGAEAQAVAAPPFDSRPQPAAAAASAPVARPASTPAAAGRAAAPTPPAAPTDLKRVQITGNTAGDADSLQRQQSTAAKIIVGRDEIDKFGDSNLGDVLKRLPGVTIGGTPGRGGGPRMRGLGGGYTQLLINGEPIPAGFSLESLTPEQVERIEILRAPTAEFGARAIAGTINIVLREALQKRLNDLRIGSNFERGRTTPGISWTRNDKLGDGPGSAYNLSVSAFHRKRVDDIDNRSSITDLADPSASALKLQQYETGRDNDARQGLNISGRLQWRLGEGDSLTLQPFMFASQGESNGTRRLVQTSGSSAAPYATADTSNDSSFRVARVNGQWQKRLGSGTRMELRVGGGGFNNRYATLRPEFDGNGAPSRTLADEGTLRERSWTSIGKLSHELASEHSLVTGWDLESIDRTEQRSTLQNGQPLLAGFGNELNASSRRVALYIQDEWNPTKQWSAYAGLRWERIATRSKDALNPVSRQSAVWTPLSSPLGPPSLP